ncbi:sialate O-acetylesterase [Dysgonomonas sp. 25]|uniref:sialate O-acetylesterase n=1 Tax=Dysgonomonas sp. 25 TaxID=2302933 RepID=UPI0013D6B3B2|nr:sialate O-acetylesterase [Dysgonomonas sp. 25]NDV67979.1 9-O-acetylesterase [Dysgonomonas sp. 25]
MKNRYLILFLFLISTISLSAQVKLSPLFSDNMVLQQQTDAPFWGKTKPKKQVKITTSWNNKQYTVQADAQGNWKTTIETPSAGGPYTITISDGKVVKLNNVMIGEVWLCSGQSNMEMQVEGWGKVNNYQQELVEAQKYPNIRLLNVEKAISTVPLSDFKAAGNGWQVCSSETVANFSAVGYFFSRDIHKYQNVPVGIINSSWSGTIAEAWVSGESLEAMPDFAEAVEQVRSFPEDKEKQGLFYQNQLENWKKSVDNKDKGAKNGSPVWAALQANDDDWDEMKVPGFMQDQGLLGFNGIVWFRKTIDIPANWAGKELTLNLGAIDDNDFTYFNGVEIGYTEGWMANRTYKVPANLVKAGKAVITVRVIDTGGSGGIYGEPKSIYIEASPSDRQPLAGNWKYKVSLNVNDLPPIPVDVRENPNSVTLLYNGMLNPIAPYSLKGAIWYQGEANTGRAYQYRDLLPLLIRDWRRQWGTKLHFYIVQLANFTKLQTEPVESTWAELREAQTRTLNLENTGMAVTIDIGEADDIHPKNKQDVGKRLALAARAKTYGEKIPYSGPMFDSYKIEGNKIRIYFSHTDGGLKTANNELLRGFTIAGLDHRFHWADAVIEGNSVVVSCPQVVFPVTVRYAWADNPVCNLYNGIGLPASPFRTDDWPGVTSNSTK